MKFQSHQSVRHGMKAVVEASRNHRPGQPSSCGENARLRVERACACMCHVAGHVGGESRVFPDVVEQSYADSGRVLIEILCVAYTHTLREG